MEVFNDIRALPRDLIYVILEFTFYTHQLPYNKIILFNRCLEELPRPERKTIANKTYRRYKAYPMPCIGYEPENRLVYYDYEIHFKKHTIDIEVFTIECF